MTFTILYRVFVAKKYQDLTPTQQLAARNLSRFQNAHKLNRMTSLSPFSDIKLCPFDPVFKTNSQYICYKYEKCCSQGCCSSYGMYNSHSWYFWIIVALILLIFYVGSWYCKRKEMRPKRRARAANSTASTTNSSPRFSSRRPSEENADHFLDYLISSYRLQTVNEVAPKGSGNLEPPPKYQEALKMPKLARSNIQIVQIHTNGAETSTALPQNVEGCSEVPPTYEDAVQISKQDGDENG